MGESFALLRPSVNDKSLRVESRPERLHDPRKAEGVTGNAVRIIPNSEEFSMPLSGNSTNTVKI